LSLYIQNMGPHDDPDKLGERIYELRDTNGLLTTFRHQRRDGLSACLRAAADAVDRARESAAAALLIRLRHESDK
jgi:hypothetical protein